MLFKDLPIEALEPIVKAIAKAGRNSLIEGASVYTDEAWENDWKYLLEHHADKRLYYWYASVALRQARAVTEVLADVAFHNF